MLRILEFVRSGDGLNDDELVALIRERMLRIPAATQRNWLRQLILALDGYGGAHQLSAAHRVRAAVRLLETELAAQATTKPAL